MFASLFPAKGQPKADARSHQAASLCTAVTMT
jgi:hypothetical protein